LIKLRGPAGAEETPGGRTGGPGEGDELPATPDRLAYVDHCGKEAKMASNIQQNRLVIQLARECLENNGFGIILRHQDQGTYPRVYTIAERGGARYLIAATGREEVRADGELNPGFNLVQNPKDQQAARKLENEHHNAIPAFVAVALRCKDGRFSAYFGRLGGINFRRQVPMLHANRQHYEQLVPRTSDPRVAALYER
jgi:hypothetical protein